MWLGPHENDRQSTFLAKKTSARELKSRKATATVCHLVIRDSNLSVADVQRLVDVEAPWAQGGENCDFSLNSREPNKEDQHPGHHYHHLVKLKERRTWGASYDFLKQQCRSVEVFGHPNCTTDYNTSENAEKTPPLPPQLSKTKRANGETAQQILTPDTKNNESEKNNKK